MATATARRKREKAAPPPPPATPWPADKVERWAVDDLVPYARNSRQHSPAQIEQVAASIKEFGFTIPILVAEDGTIIAGHARTLAAKALGLVEVPVMVAAGWTDEQRRLYTIADNQLALNGTWDDELLRVELTELTAGGFAVGVIGFAPEEVNAIMNGWNADLQKLEKTALDGTGLNATIRVTCLETKVAEVLEVVQAAVNGMPNVTVVKT